MLKCIKISNITQYNKTEFMEDLMVKIVLNKAVKKIIAQNVLLDLPEWFGIPEYTTNYIEQSSLMPFFAIYEEEDPVGFIALKATSIFTAEIYCMGILKQHHRNGYGKQLFETFEKYAKKENFKLLQVKTVQQGKYDIYDRTNEFYRSMGFYELEVFPTLWDKSNPCQIFVKPI